MATIPSYAVVRTRSEVAAQVASPADPTAKVLYRVVVVGRDGTPVAELENAVIQNLTWVLNDDETMVFSLPSTDSKITKCKVPTQEVQVYYGRRLLFWGLMVRADSNPQTTTFQCVSLAWYFRRRHVGAIPKAPYTPFINGSFENGMYGWGFIAQGSASFQVSGVHSTVAFTVPGRSARMATINPEDADCYVEQFWSHSVPTTNYRPTVMTAVGWLYVSNYVYRSIENRGLWLEARQTGKLISAFTRIDENTPRNVWVRNEVSIELPPSVDPYTCSLRAYVPGTGTVNWDEISVSVDRRLPFWQTEQKDIVKGLVDHAQDTTYGKTDLNIDHIGPETGVKRDREYLFSNHEVIRDLIDEFATLANGMDWGMTFAQNRRYLQTFPHKGLSGGKGVVRRNEVLEHGRNIASYSVQVDGEQTANYVAVLAAGEGSDREEGAAYSLTEVANAGGLSLEKVYNATPGSAVQSLQSQADRGLNRYKKPVVIPSITTYEGDTRLIGNLRTGDTVRVKIKHGWIDLNGWYRIVQMSLDPKANTITFTLTPYEDPI